MKKFLVYPCSLFLLFCNQTFTESFWKKIPALFTSKTAPLTSPPQEPIQKEQSYKKPMLQKETVKKCLSILQDEIKILTKKIQRQGSSLHQTNPTFLQVFLKKATPEIKEKIANVYTTFPELQTSLLNLPKIQAKFLQNQQQLFSILGEIYKPENELFRYSNLQMLTETLETIQNKTQRLIKKANTPIAN